MKHQSTGGCLMTTCLLTTMCSSTASGFRQTVEEDTGIEMHSVAKCYFFSSLSPIRLGSSSQSPSQEDGEDHRVWKATDRVYGSSTVVQELEPNSLYAFRVQSCRNSMFSPYSPEVTFHTPPAPGRPQSHDKMSQSPFVFVFTLHDTICF